MLNGKNLAIISGTMFGIGAIVLKLFLVERILLYVPITLLFGFFGFVFMQYSLKRSKTDVSALLILSSSSIVAIFGGVFYLAETITILEFIGIIFILFGAINIKKRATIK